MLCSRCQLNWPTCTRRCFFVGALVGAALFTFFQIFQLSGFSDNFRGLVTQQVAWNYLEQARSYVGPETGSPQSPPPLGILVVGDSYFQQRYATQLQSQRCFAKKNGYEHVVLSSFEYDACAHIKDFFFRKHCSIAEYLESRPLGWRVVVLDADVVAVVLERGLDRWANYPSDIQLYERITMHEIMAGNYMLRNGPFARSFLRLWASWHSKKPPGFSSSDNGAIHLVVMQITQVQGFERCRALYGNLTAQVDNLDPYWEFVMCTKAALGPPRHWAAHGGSLTIWPRAQFFVVDGVYLDRLASRTMGPVMHHGIKEAHDVVRHYYQGRAGLAKCQISTHAVQRERILSEVALRTARGYSEYFQQGHDCSQCVERCIARFSCLPLEDGDPPLPKRLCSNCTR